MPLTVVSRRLGHSSIAIARDVYQLVTSEEHADAAAPGAAIVLGKALAPTCDQTA